MTEQEPSTFSRLPWHELNFMEERFVDDAGAKLHFAESPPDPSFAAGGQAFPTIVFFHGVLRDWRSFYPLLCGLRGKAHLVSMDFRGHGRSASVANSYRVTDYIEDAVRLVRQMPAPVFLYGHSLGAMVAIATASQIPNQIQAAILEDPPFETMGERLPQTPLMSYFQSVEQVVQSLASDTDNRESSSVTDERIQRLYEAFSDIVVGKGANGQTIRLRDQRDAISRRFSAESLAKIDPAVLQPITAGRWLDGYSLERCLPSITARITLLRADASCGGMLTQYDANRIHERLKGHCEVIDFPGVGHSVHWAQPSEVLQIVRDRFQLTCHV